MEFHDKEFYAVVLGALLHDIGKFVQRAQNKPKTQDHSHWGGNGFKIICLRNYPIFFLKKRKIS